jgi:hypothetical protein
MTADVAGTADNQNLIFQLTDLDSKDASSAPNTVKSPIKIDIISKLTQFPPDYNLGMAAIQPLKSDTEHRRRLMKHRCTHRSEGQAHAPAGLSDFTK